MSTYYIPATKPGAELIVVTSLTLYGCHEHKQRQSGVGVTACDYLQAGKGVLGMCRQGDLGPAGCGVFAGVAKGAGSITDVCRSLAAETVAHLCPSAEPEGLVGASSPRPSPLLPESLESESVEAADGEPEPDAEAPSSSNSEPGTPRAGRSAIRAGGGTRAERCAGVHISDPYNVNLPLHISSILSVPPNIISNVALVRLTRGLECPALQPRPSPASGPGPGPGLGPGPPGEDPGATQHWERGLELQVELRHWGHQKPPASGFGWVTSAGSLVQGWGIQ